MTQSDLDFTGIGGADGKAALDRRLADLVALGGPDKVVAMLGRFCVQLEAVQTDLHASAIDPAMIHRFIGLAGIFGFSKVDLDCRRLIDSDLAEDARLDALISVTAALAYIDQWRSRKAGARGWFAFLPRWR